MANPDPPSAASTVSDRRVFLIPLDLVIKARTEGLTLERLQEVVRLSIRCTHPEGNRRYEDLIFKVVGNRVTLILIEGKKLELEAEVVFKCVTCKDTGRVRVFDQCEHCDGTGCPKCDQGLIPSSIPCPTCALNAMLSKHG